MTWKLMLLSVDGGSCCMDKVNLNRFIAFNHTRNLVVDQWNLHWREAAVPCQPMMELLRGEHGVHGASPRRTWSPWSFSVENVESMELLRGEHGVHGASPWRTWSPWIFSVENVESMELRSGERGVHGASQRRTWSPWSFSVEST
jgi:hypothetical protein